MTIGSVTLAWTAVADAQGVFPAGYILLADTSTHDGGVYTDYPIQVDVGNVTTGQVPNLVAGTTYFLSAIGYDSDHNVLTYSLLSPEITAVAVSGSGVFINVPAATLTLTTNAPVVLSLYGVMSNIFNAGRGVLHPIFALATPPAIFGGASRIGFSSRTVAGASYFTSVSGISSVSSGQSSAAISNFNKTVASRFGVSSRSTVNSQQTGGATAIFTSGRSSFGVRSRLIATVQTQAGTADCASSFGVSSASTIRTHGTLVWDRIVSPGGIWTKIDPP